MNTPIQIIERELLQLYRGFFKEIKRDIPYPFSQMEVLKYLSEYGTSSMKDIAAHLSITPPSATQLIDILFENELIKREASPTDRRTTLIALTPKATACITELKKKKDSVAQKTFSILSPEDQKELIRILSIINTK